MHHFINDWKHFSFNRLSWNTNWFHWCYQIIWISWKILQQYTLHLADSNSRRTIHWGYIYHLWIGGWCYLWVRLHLIIFDILSKLYWKRKNIHFRKDYLSIYDGNSNGAPVLGKYCGDFIPTSHISSSNELFILFETDNDIISVGFAIEYGTTSKFFCNTNICQYSKVKVVTYKKCIHFYETDFKCKPK